MALSGSISGTHITGPIEMGIGFLSHSNSPGEFEMNGNIALNTNYQLRLDSVSLYDSMRASGSVALTGITQLFLETSSLSANVGDAFMILNKTSAGPILGAFEGRPEGARFESGGFEFQITYTGGDGNDIVLTVVPEPGSVLLVGLGLALCVRRVRSRCGGSRQHSTGVGSGAGIAR